ncbi:probable enoyl-CoA hydratase, mitochondrial isoform X1 [Callorhinchus milii]|uniref:probable enoyl-CoA hydratase, mitochondrial isoform X1 n=1 Tax=Callorhinchus milii TaxID=7868 RepID=UPI001C3FA6EA|nr:probable enoyl-CoA hydratase, mitochondrial isoform X1 [Callorhinchus milii]
MLAAGLRAGLRAGLWAGLWAGLRAGLRGGIDQGRVAQCRAPSNSFSRSHSLTQAAAHTHIIRRGFKHRGAFCLEQNRKVEKSNVITEKIGTIITIGINRPEIRNAVNKKTAQHLLDAFTAFERDKSLTAAVLHGTGGNFCAGYDLKELAQVALPVKFEQDVTREPGPLGPSRMQFSKPVLAAVSGYAVAGGMELSLLADLRIVEQSAIMGVFCRRFGVPLIDGGTVRLPKLIGLSRAMDLILTGRPIGAQEAYEFGLANRIVPDGQALQHAIKLAEQISTFPQQCLVADRASAYYSTFNASSFTEAMQFEFDNAKHAILEEAIPGAERFSSGAGRSGIFT